MAITSEVKPHRNPPNRIISSAIVECAHMVSLFSEPKDARHCCENQCDLDFGPVLLRYAPTVLLL